MELSELYLKKWIEQSTALNLKNQETPMIDIYLWWEEFFKFLQDNPDKLLDKINGIQIWHISEMRDLIQEKRIVNSSGEAFYYDLIKATGLTNEVWKSLDTNEKAIQLALVKYQRTQEFINNMWKIYDIGMKTQQPSPKTH